MNGWQNSLGRVALCVTMVSAVTAYAAKDGSDLPDALLKCVSMQDDTERLACFDKEVGNPDVAPEPVQDDGPDPGATAATETEVEPVQDDRADQGATAATQTEVEPVAVVAVAATQPRAEAPASGDTVESFGLSSWKDKEDEIREITSTVTNVSKRAYGQLVVTLANGHVWTEKDPVQGFRVREGDTLTIRKGTFGGFRMVTSGNISSPAIRME